MAMDRRGFLQVGAGLLIGFVLPESAESANEEPPYPGLYGPFPAMAIMPPDGKPNAYIHIGADEIVTLMITRSEMGQGAATTCAQLLAEELECDWTKVRTQFAPIDTALYGYQGTVGSRTTRTMWGPLRKAGAEGREILIAAAAQKWGVDRARCKAQNGFVINLENQARLSYGSLAESASKQAVPANVTLKDPKEHRIIGKPLKRVDTRDKVLGRAKFGLDVRFPGMVYAAVARCPVFGGKVGSFDAARAKAVPGVKEVFQIATGIAVVSDNTWSAIQACRALEVQWDEGPDASLNSDAISKMFGERAQEKGLMVRQSGDFEASLAKAAKKIEAVYEVPFLAHATMEPMNCTAHVRPDGCDVWAPTQCGTDSRDMTAAMTGLAPEKINFQVTYMGGGFGRRGNFELDFVGEAVEISKRLGVPVKVVWSREDDMQHDYYRPASHVEFIGALDADGWPVGLSTRIACPPIPAGQVGINNTAVTGLRDFLYNFPNLWMDYRPAGTSIPVAMFRAPGANQNTFFMESFLDEMAAAGGKDPVEVRRRLLASPDGDIPYQPQRAISRLRGVLDLAVEKAHWGQPLPPGRFHGVALGNNVGSFIAQIAEVSVTQGKVRVHKVVCAFDCGQVVNPSLLEQQLTGGIGFGLAAALKGAITIDQGRVREANFNTYDLLRMDEMPKIEVYILPSTEEPGGAGEASVPAIAPAVTNAIFFATGKRIRKLPIKKVDLT